jgi:hypothetical protein
MVDGGSHPVSSATSLHPRHLLWVPLHIMQWDRNIVHVTVYTNTKPVMILHTEENVVFLHSYLITAIEH